MLKKTTYLKPTLVNYFKIHFSFIAGAFQIAFNDRYKL